MTFIDLFNVFGTFSTLLFFFEPFQLLFEIVQTGLVVCSLWWNIVSAVIKHGACCDKTMRSLWRNIALAVKKHCARCDETLCLLWWNIARAVMKHCARCDETLRSMWRNIALAVKKHCARCEETLCSLWFNIVLAVIVTTHLYWFIIVSFIIRLFVHTFLQLRGRFFNGEESVAAKGASHLNPRCSS